MPTPKRTTVSSSWTELSAFMSNALLAEAIRPVAMGEMRPISTTGSSAMIGLRKMISSSRTMITTVPAATSIPARAEESLSSSACAAEPVTPALSSVPSRSGFRSLRSSLTASCGLLSLGSVTLGIATAAVCTRLLGETGPGATESMPLILSLFSAVATLATAALSRAVSRAPSERWKTMIAPMFCCWGKSLSWTSEALIDS